MIPHRALQAAAVVALVSCAPAYAEPKLVTVTVESEWVALPDVQDKAECVVGSPPGVPFQYRRDSPVEFKGQKDRAGVIIRAHGGLVLPARVSPIFVRSTGKGSVTCLFN